LTEKETVYLTEKEKENYLDFIYRLQTAQSPTEALFYKKQIEGLIQVGKVRAKIELKNEISKRKVAKRLLGTDKLSIKEIAEIVELTVKEVEDLNGN
jgi:predicted transposase YdaD